jgi:hypothetical protein
MDNYYAEALRDYAAVTDEALHSYLIEGLSTGMIHIRPRRRGPESGRNGGFADVNEAAALFCLLLLSTRVLPQPLVRPLQRVRALPWSRTRRLQPKKIEQSSIFCPTSIDFLALKRQQSSSSSRRKNRTCTGPAGEKARYQTLYQELYVPIMISGWTHTCPDIRIS